MSAQLESLYICISLDYLMTLQDFFISGLPTGGNVNQTRSRTTSISLEKPSIEQGNNESNRLRIDPRLTRPSIAVPKPPPKLPPNPDTEVETRVDVIVKNPEIILLEDQHNTHSNCLVLDVSQCDG